MISCSPSLASMHKSPLQLAVKGRNVNLRRAITSQYSVICGAPRMAGKLLV